MNRAQIDSVIGHDIQAELSGTSRRTGPTPAAKLAARFGGAVKSNQLIVDYTLWYERIKNNPFASWSGKPVRLIASSQPRAQAPAKSVDELLAEIARRQEQYAAESETAYENQQAESEWLTDVAEHEAMHATVGLALNCEIAEIQNFAAQGRAREVQ